MPWARSRARRWAYAAVLAGILGYPQHLVDVDDEIPGHRPRAAQGVRPRQPREEAVVTVQKCTCALGHREDAAQIDAALRAGEGVRAVAAQFKVGKTAVHDHRRICLGMRGASATRPVKPAAAEPSSSADTSPDASADTADTASALSPDAASPDARARQLPWQELVTVDDRVAYVADRIASRTLARARVREPPREGVVRPPQHRLRLRPDGPPWSRARTVARSPRPGRPPSATGPGSGSSPS